ncbi:MBG domain-containing protein [Brevundimonas diminuta]|uniref:MBG domain-containing protein n=1 Tax=Brevundimonas diminuta TaxID=293 RepID=UPI003207D1B2
MAAPTAMAQPLPTGGTVTHGDAAITNAGSNLLVTQSSHNAIVSWQSFSVGGGVKVHFENGNGATLNRVTGNLPSIIDGSLTATGSLYLINPAGVAVGAGGMVRTGGSFVASTHDASDADFLNGGGLTLKGASQAAVVNNGYIVSRSGDVVLTARRVENAGTLEAANGSVGLLSGYEVLLRDLSLADGKFAVQVGGSDTEAFNTGAISAAGIELRANGGSVQALAGNTQAIIKATGVENIGGRLFLTAGSDGAVKATQTLAARSTDAEGAGGEVHIRGGKVNLGGVIDVAGSGGSGGVITATAGGGSLSLLSSARLDATGDTGGLVLLGGDYMGGEDPVTRYLDVPMERAGTASIAEGATITADGWTGDGGDVVVWSDGLTTIKGQITARGGAGGDGGTIETSGRTVDFIGATINASAKNGRAGLWLVDPVDLVIGKAAAETAQSMLNGGTNATFATRDSSAGGPNGYVTSTGPGDITVSAPITWSSGATLTLDSYRSVVINAPITITGAGGLSLLTNQGGGAGGSIYFGGGVQYTGSGGSLMINKQAYTLLYSMAELQGINTDTLLSDRYALARSLDAAGVASWQPLGVRGAGILNAGNGFSGDFTGLGNTISNLAIDTGSNGWTGLFGWSSGSITDLGLIGGSVTGGSRVGGLVGVQNGGEIARSYVTGTVTGSGTRVGGLVGVQIGGAIKQAYATGAVQGDSAIGGLVGHQDGTAITQSYATGTVTGGGINIGGLVGLQDGGSIEQAYATGAVTGGSDVGGLVGWRNGGAITDSYFDSYSTGQGASNGVGNIANAPNIIAVTSDPTQSGAINYAYNQSAYAGLTFTSEVRGLGWFMLDGQTRPFGAWEYSQNVINSHQLQLVNMNLGASYQLGRSLDLAGAFGRTGAASALAADSAGMWNRGFVPLGTDGVGGLLGGNGFAGTFTGGGHTISNLIVDTGNAGYAGLFGWSSGAIDDIGLIGGWVKGGDYTGGLVGYQAAGDVARAYATGAVTGEQSVGGLVGLQSGDITQSYAKGAVKGAAGIGGLVGTQWGAVTQSYATGAVTGSGEFAGGLVGLQSGDITQAYATGAVKGVLYVGGLVGRQEAGDITQTYATGAVTGNGTNAGGLVGWQNGGSIVSSYFDRDTTGVNESDAVGNINHSLGVTAVTSDPTRAGAANYAYKKSAYAGFDWTVWAPPSAAAGADPAYHPELFGVSGVVGVDYGDWTITYGEAIPAFGAPSTFYGLGYFNTLIASPGAGSVDSANAGIHQILGTGGAASFTPGGSSRIVGVGVLTVTPAQLTITAGNAAKFYGEEAILSDFTAVGLKNNETIGSVTLNSAGAGAGANAADTPYAITASNASGSGFDAANYVITYVDGGLTVLRRPITVTADDLSRIYGDANPVLTWTVGGMGLVNGDALSGHLSTLADRASNVGRYDINQGTLAASSNYALTFNVGALSIGQRAITVTADDLSRIYGDANPVLTWTVGGMGLVNGDSLSGALATAADSASNVGRYDIDRGTLGVSSNYALTFNVGALSIGQRAIAVAADDLSRIYGDANPALTWTVGGMGLVNGDALSGALATVANAASNVGRYDINQGTLAASPNYALTFNAGALNIGQRALTVTADDLSRLLGQPDPVLTWTITGGGLASFDTIDTVFSGTLMRAPGEAIGDYAIGQGSLAATDNYRLSVLDGMLTIAPSDMTQSRLLERPASGQTSFVATSGEEGDASDKCTEGVLGPLCAASVNPINRKLGSNISWSAQ